MFNDWLYIDGITCSIMPIWRYFVNSCENMFPRTSPKQRLLIPLDTSINTLFNYSEHFSNEIGQMGVDYEIFTPLIWGHCLLFT